MSGTQSHQILALTGFRFRANLGILEHELASSQPIEVDAELNMANQLEQPAADQLHAVLDYRNVHEIILDECTAVHVNMLESMTGKLCMRLMQLPNVIGVRVKIVKLEIFDDCVVSIKKQTGQWST